MDEVVVWLVEWFTCLLFLCRSSYPKPVEVMEPVPAEAENAPAEPKVEPEKSQGQEKEKEPEKPKDQEKVKETQHDRVVGRRRLTVS